MHTVSVPRSHFLQAALIFPALVVFAQITYTGTALRDRVGDVVNTLAECIVQPMLRGWEVEEEKVCVRAARSCINVSTPVA